VIFVFDSPYFESTLFVGNQPLGHQLAVLALRPLEPNVVGAPAQRPLHHAQHAALPLAHHRVAVVRGQDLRGKKVNFIRLANFKK
jgi:hypothetical protein